MLHIKARRIYKQLIQRLKCRTYKVNQRKCRKCNQHKHGKIQHDLAESNVQPLTLNPFYLNHSRLSPSFALYSSLEDNSFITSFPSRNVIIKRTTAIADEYPIWKRIKA